MMIISPRQFNLNTTWILAHWWYYLRSEALHFKKYVPRSRTEQSRLNLHRHEKFLLQQFNVPDKKWKKLYKLHTLFNFRAVPQTEIPDHKSTGRSTWNKYLNFEFFWPRILRYTVFSKNCPKFGRTWSTTVSNRNLGLEETLKLYQ